MTSSTVSDKLKTMAKDLSHDYPRSPRATLGGFVLAARMADKCRATLAGTAGEYHFNCPLDRRFFDFTGIDADETRDFIASGASDEELGEWLRQKSKVKDEAEIVQWNNKQRDMRLSDLPAEIQVYMEHYIQDYVPAGKIVYHWFDVYDYEEGRL